MDTRSEMTAILKSIHQHSGVTVLHVTHSHAEAEWLTDCIFRLEDGTICRQEFSRA